MNINDLMPSAYLKNEDLQGKKIAVEIEEIVIEEMGADKEKKPVLRFVGKEKGLVLNKTKLRMLEMLFNSPETDDWLGHRIIIRPGVTSYQGQPKKCIDIDSELPQLKVAAHAASAGEPDLTDEEMTF